MIPPRHLLPGLVSLVVTLGSCAPGMVLPPPDFPDLGRAGLLQAVDLSEGKSWVPGIVDGAGVQGIVKGYSRWRGTVTMTGDVLVPRGGVLVIDPGTVIKVSASPSSRTDPEFLANETELLVEGRLEARGGGQGITFEAEGASDTWYGIILHGEGASGGTLQGVVIRDAEQGITLLDASPAMDRVSIEEGSYGILVLGNSRPTVSGLRLDSLDYGMVGGGVDAAFTGIRERLSVVHPPRQAEQPPAPRGVVPGGAPPVTYLGREKTHFIVRDTEWRGRVVIDGTVQVVAGAILTILPGTRVEFTPFDYQGDGIGDSQIIVSGGLKVLGEPDRNVLFTSVRKGGPGSWGMVSLLASDREDNIIRHARFENAYRGFHNHFSTLHVESTVFSGNLRGLQFQEADIVLRKCWIGSNLSGFRCRDSRLVLEETVIDGNAAAASILRSSGRITACRISGNILEGLWIRESEALTIEATSVSANRRGIRARDSVLDLVGCTVAGNAENGLSLQGGRVAVSGSWLGSNGLDGISVEGTEATLRGNDIVGNGEFAIDNQGQTDVTAVGTWWGGRDPAVRDKATDPARGAIVRTEEAAGPNTPWGQSPTER
jgi:hypothetical protein